MADRACAIAPAWCENAARVRSASALALSSVAFEYDFHSREHSVHWDGAGADADTNLVLSHSRLGAGSFCRQISPICSPHRVASTVCKDANCSPSERRSRSANRVIDGLGSRQWRSYQVRRSHLPLAALTNLIRQAERHSSL